VATRQRTHCECGTGDSVKPELITAITFAAVLMLGAVLYGAYSAQAIALGTPMPVVLLGAIVAYFAIPFVAVVQWFALAWIHRSPRPPGKRIGVAATLRLFVGELWSVAGSPIRMGLLWWWMRDPAPAPAAAPVLLLHGVGCNAGVWLRVRARLRGRGLGPLYTLSYGPPLASIEVFAAQVAEKVDSIVSATGAAKVTLVGHSMGGLVARAYLRRFGAGSVRALVTIGTPHRGSMHARFFPGTCLAEMCPGSEWLETLNLGDAPAGPRCVALWSWHDSMVTPQLSARWDGAESVEFVGIGHNELLANAEVLASLAGLLEREAREAEAAMPPRA
jgi:pimeloyl-ACP methyl ester carboxylesterase